MGLTSENTSRIIIKSAFPMGASLQDPIIISSGRGKALVALASVRQGVQYCVMANH